MTLKEARKLAARGQQVSRAEASGIIPRAGQPYVHVGNERYVRLSDAVYYAGTGHAITLVHDRRSLLLWPGYLRTASAVVVLILGSGHHEQDALTIDTRMPVPSLIRSVAELDTDGDIPPATRAAVEIARTIQALQAEQDRDRQYLFTVPRSPEQVQALLEIQLTAATALALRDGEEIDQAAQREVAASLIFDPGPMLAHVHQGLRNP